MECRARLDMQMVGVGKSSTARPRPGGVLGRSDCSSASSWARGAGSSGGTGADQQGPRESVRAVVAESEVCQLARRGQAGGGRGADDHPGSRRGERIGRCPAGRRIRSRDPGKVYAEGGGAVGGEGDVAAADGAFGRWRREVAEREAEGAGVEAEAGCGELGGREALIGCEEVGGSGAGASSVCG